MQKKKARTKKEEQKSPPVKIIKKIDTKTEKKIKKSVTKTPEKVSKNKKSYSKTSENKLQEKIPIQNQQEITRVIEETSQIKEKEEPYNKEETKLEISDEETSVEESNIELEVSKPQEIGEVSEIEKIERQHNKEETRKNETDLEDPEIEKTSVYPLNDFQDEKNKVEALLFACGRYIEEEELSELIGIEKKKVHKALEGLRKDYESQKNSLMIFQEEKSWKINVRERYLPLVRKIVSETELGKSAMETLAVIAWKSPVYQNEVVKIRGNKCYDHIEDLENMGYISKDKKGRSYILKTTEKFYTYFDIDRKNLQGVLDAAKKPEAKEIQASLEQVETPQEEKRSIVDAINVKKKTESEEEKLSQEEFLKKIEEKISIAKEKNEQFEEELPRPKLDEPQQSTNSQETKENSEQKEVTEQTSTPDASQENTNTNQQPINNVQDPQKKQKSLTKKQLEKKFKEELLRVREKMGQ